MDIILYQAIFTLADSKTVPIRLSENGHALKQFWYVELNPKVFK